MHHLSWMLPESYDLYTGEDSDKFHLILGISSTFKLSEGSFSIRSNGPLSLTPAWRPPLPQRLGESGSGFRSLLSGVSPAPCW